MDNFSQYKEIEKKVNSELNRYFDKGFSLLSIMLRNGTLRLADNGVQKLSTAKREGQSTEWFIEYELLSGEDHATNLFHIGWIKKDMSLTIYFKLNQDKGYSHGDEDYSVPLECKIYLDDKLMDSNSVDINTYFATDEIYGYIKEYSLSDFE